MLEVYDDSLLPIQTTCYICVVPFLVALTIHVVGIVASLFTIHSFSHLKMQVGSVRPMKDAWVHKLVLHVCMLRLLVNGKCHLF